MENLVFNVTAYCDQQKHPESSLRMYSLEEDIIEQSEKKSYCGIINREQWMNEGEKKMIRAEIDIRHPSSQLQLQSTDDKRNETPKWSRMYWILTGRVNCFGHVVIDDLNFRSANTLCPNLEKREKHEFSGEPVFMYIFCYISVWPFYYYFHSDIWLSKTFFLSSISILQIYPSAKLVVTQDKSKDLILKELCIH